jgi:DNA polymerase-3 subunit alpha
MLSETYDLIRAKKDKTFTSSSIKYSDRKTSNWFKAVRAKSFSRFMFEKDVKKQLAKMKFDCSFSDIVLLDAFDFFPQALGADAAADLCKKKRGRNFPAEAEKILAETYGKLIYQEQFDQLVQTVAGWDFTKADMLRSNMGKRKYDEIKKAEKEFIECLMRKGVSEDSARELFEYLCESSIYLVSKSYSIGQARLLWIESYFRAHYPSVFISRE